MVEAVRVQGEPSDKVCGLQMLEGGFFIFYFF